MKYVRLTGAARNLQVLSSGDPKRIARRGKNIVVAKALGKVGFWHLFGKLWR